MIRTLLILMFCISLYAGYIEKDWWNFIIWVQLWSCVAMYCICLKTTGYDNIFASIFLLLLFFMLLNALRKVGDVPFFTDLIADIIAITYLMYRHPLWQRLKKKS